MNFITATTRLHRASIFTNHNDNNPTIDIADMSGDDNIHNKCSQEEILSASGSENHIPRRESQGRRSNPTQVSSVILPPIAATRTHLHTPSEMPNTSRKYCQQAKFPTTTEELEGLPRGYSNSRLPIDKIDDFILQKGPKRFKCIICRQHFAWMENARTHVNDSHDSSRGEYSTFKCKYCEFISISWRSVQNHKALMHN